MAKPRMASTSVQFSDEQFIRLEKIRKISDASSNAEVLRAAFDFYTLTKFPKLIAK